VLIADKIVVGAEPLGYLIPREVRLVGVTNLINVV
jgi:hypothetical protein